MDALLDARYFKVAGLVANMTMHEPKHAYKRDDINGKFTSTWAKVENMGKQERKLRTLELLVTCDLAVTPQVLFMNLKLRGATFERRSVTTYINELESDGYVKSISINERFTMYTSTDAGEEYFHENDPTPDFSDKQGGVKG